MKFYSNAAPNTDKGINFMTSTEAFKAILDAFLVYETNSLQQYFVMSNQIKIKRNATIDAVASDVTYIYDNVKGKDYFYHVKSMTMLNDNIIFDVARDTWAMEVMTKPEKIRRLKIYKSNRNVGVGVYDNIKITHNYPIFSNMYDMPETDFAVAFTAVYDIATISGQLKEKLTPAIATFALTYDQLKAALDGLGFPPQPPLTVLDFAIRLLSSMSLYWQGGFDQGHEQQSFKVIRAYAIDKNLLNISNQAEDVDFYMGRKESIKVYHVNPTVLYRDCTIDKFDPNFEYYAGTKTANMKLLRTNEKNVKISLQVTTKQDGLEMKIMQGDKQLNITNAFELNLTMTEGTLTAQQNINKSIEAISSIANAGVSFATGNVGSGLLSLGHTASSFATNGGNSNYTKGGDGYSTFRNIDGSIASPFVLVKYASTDNELQNAATDGINFEIIMTSLQDFMATPWLDGIEELHPDAIIQADARDLSYFTLDAQEVISRRLHNGVILAF